METAQVNRDRNCELCHDMATIIVRWCSKTAPWRAAMCDKCMRHAWEECVRIGSVDGWSMGRIADKSFDAPV